ncbi:YebC/PmpR family DNA-binding transcriptional regulator [Thiotrichales bacterium 19S3-7]|nr:YebC/PmpR family DNA-binding transcriptional regulator [Thiotrichales bacterium 19S3-7]MCF6801204.1 YebC/PmpR family DNA-binding transcriptional regulator [Thiotrichales bacterium 19S3-11]
MAGHSKWANIKHRKAAQDAKRGKVFTKLIRELTVAAKMGGDDPTANPRLRAAVQTALSQNMTRDTIDRAIKRGAGGDDTTQLEEIRYEGYGPGGVAIMVDCMTDNRNRTVAEVRHAFTKAGGNLGTDGSVSYLFSKQGIIGFNLDIDEEAVFEVALEAGAEDVISDEYAIEVITTPESFSDVKDALDAAGFEAENAEVTMIASTKADLDKETAEKVLAMIDRLEDLDDVQNVYSNAEISSDVLAALAE